MHCTNFLMRYVIIKPDTNTIVRNSDLCDSCFFQMQRLRNTISLKTLKLFKFISNIGTHVCRWCPKVVVKYLQEHFNTVSWSEPVEWLDVFLTVHHELTIYTMVGTLIVATIYLQLIQNRYMFRSFTVLQCSHQHCVQPVASVVEVVGYL